MDWVERYKMNSAMRLFMLISACLIWGGILLTGWKDVHGLLYIPAVFFLFAAVTGICPGFIFTQILLQKDEEPVPPGED